MKKLVLSLVLLLLAAPAMAVRVDVTAVCDGNTVEIQYATDGNLPRGFAIDITVTDGNILTCVPDMVGECNSTVKGYGIFPGTISIDGAGNVTDYGTPVAPQGDLPGDTQPGLCSSGITIEQGSLYVDGNSPATSGLLCTITVSDECTVNLAPNVSRAGVGVVMENPSEIPDVNLVGCDVFLDCFREGMVDCCGNTITAAQVATWVGLGKPLCWCDPCHCRGDASRDGVISSPDVMILRAAWPGFGGPYDPCADFNYDGVISSPDVMILRASWPGFGGPGCTGCP
jgi:hypothetical protein